MFHCVCISDFVHWDTTNAKRRFYLAIATWHIKDSLLTCFAVWLCSVRWSTSEIVDEWSRESCGWAVLTNCLQRTHVTWYVLQQKNAQLWIAIASWLPVANLVQVIQKTVQITLVHLTDAWVVNSHNERWSVGLLDGANCHVLSIASASYGTAQSTRRLYPLAHALEARCSTHAFAEGRSAVT